MEASLRRVLPSEELPAGSPTRPEIRRIRTGESEVLVARLHGGKVVAFATTCPHQETDLDDATEWEGSIRCPRHLYLYDPRTGENILPTRDASPEKLWKLRPGYLPVHRVEERDGWIWVADAPEPPPAAYDPENERRPTGPAVPEAIPAAVTESGPVEHPTELLEATAGEELEVVLVTSPRPGYLWREELPDQLVVVSQCFDAAAGSGLRVRLRARDAGTVTMRWGYARPWDVEPAEVRSFVVRIGPAQS